LLSSNHKSTHPCCNAAQKPEMRFLLEAYVAPGRLPVGLACSAAARRECKYSLLCKDNVCVIKFIYLRYWFFVFTFWPYVWQLDPGHTYDEHLVLALKLSVTLRHWALQTSETIWYGHQDLWSRNFLVHPSNNALSYHNLEIAAIFGIMSLHMNIFCPKLILFICSTQNVYDYFVSAQRWFETYLCVSSNWMWCWEYPIKYIIGSILTIETFSSNGP
jgi:hypothetical protein